MNKPTKCVNCGSTDMCAEIGTDPTCALCIDCCLDENEPAEDSAEDIERWRKYDDDFIPSEDGGCDTCGQKSGSDFCLNCIVCINCCTCANRSKSE
jgi:hypothetical protein